jgi:hypothetical protein
MFGRSNKILDYEKICRALVKFIGTTDKIEEARRGHYLTDHEAKILKSWIPWQQAAWSQPLITRSAPSREPVSLLRWWRAIRESRPAPAEPTPAPSGGWFSAR